MFSQVFPNFPIFTSSLKILTELEVLLLWCDMTLVQVGYKWVDPAFALDAVIDILHDCIASSILFSLSMKQQVILIDYKQTLGDLQTSSVVLPELGGWLANDSEQYRTQPPSTVRSPGLSKAVS